LRPIRKPLASTDTSQSTQNMAGQISRRGHGPHGPSCTRRLAFPSCEGTMTTCWAVRGPSLTNFGRSIHSR
jgi:hypothetical protein